MRDDVGKLEVTDAQWMAELDALRPGDAPKRAQFTPEQDAAILHARRGEHAVPWAKLSAYCRGKGWPYAENVIRRRWRELTE